MTDLGHIGGPVVIPGCVSVVIQWSLPNFRLAHNVLHARVAAGFAPTVAIANTLQSALVNDATFVALKPFLHTGTQLAAVIFGDLRTPNLATVQSTAPGVNGTGAGLPLAPQTALVVTLRTAQAGVAFRGRVYVPGWSSAAQGATQVAIAGAITALQNWANVWPTLLAAQGLTLAIAHPARAAYTGRRGTLHAARAAGTVDVTALLVRNGIWDSARRRAGKS